MNRPDCFGFAMDFLGDPEASELLAYIQELEKAHGCQCKACQIKPHDSDCSVHNEPGTPNGDCDCTTKKTTDQLLDEREANDQKISDLKRENWQLTIKMCELEGFCPRCLNTHYPHC